MRERVEDRHERILRILRARGTMRVSELAEEIGSSLETIRRDVTALSEVGRLRRVHGKVYWPSAPLNARDARLERKARSASAELVLGMVVPVVGYFYEGVIHGARAVAAAAGARLTIGITEYRPEQDARQIAAMIGAGVDGLLFTPAGGLDAPLDVDWETIATIPTVLVERQVSPGLPGATLDRVGSDHAEGAALAVRHLAALGHERIALLSRPTHTSAQVRTGYRAAMDAQGLPPDDLGNHDDIDEHAAHLLNLHEHQNLRAALVHTDTDAANLQRILAARGIRVPHDFALIAYDDEGAELADVPLTAVAPAKRAIGEAAAALLLRRIADRNSPRQHLDLLPELRIRESCGAQAERQGGGG